MRRIAVWGASGFAGSAVCRAALAAGWQVKELTRQVVDFSASEETMAKVLDGSEIAYHCAGSPGMLAVAGYANAARRFARACARAGVRRLVYLSTVAVYGPRTSGEIGTDAPPLAIDPYGKSRLEAELAIQAALRGTPCGWNTVRVPALVGTGMRPTVLRSIAWLARRGVFPHPGPPDAVFACLGVNRLSALLLRLAEAQTGTLQFADHFAWRELARRAAAQAGSRVLCLRLPALAGRFTALASTARYKDDSMRFERPEAPLPSTAEDLEHALKP